ncbi:MAG: hypothetical protein ACO2OZ_11640 [Acidilobaceae archaeon]
MTRYLSRICDIVVGLDIKPYTSWYQRGSPNVLYVVAMRGGPLYVLGLRI